MSLYLMNDEINSFEYVISTLCRLLPMCNTLQAEQIAILVHESGECHIYRGFPPNIYEYQVNVAAGITGDVNYQHVVNVQDIVAIVSCILGDGDCTDELDLTFNGIVNVIDIVSLVSNILNNSEHYDIVADFNEDGEVNVADIVSLVNYILEDYASQIIYPFISNHIPLELYYIKIIFYFTTISFVYKILRNGFIKE